MNKKVTAFLVSRTTKQTLHLMHSLVIGWFVQSLAIGRFTLLEHPRHEWRGVVSCVHFLHSISVVIQVQWHAQLENTTCNTQQRKGTHYHFHILALAKEIVIMLILISIQTHMIHAIVHTGYTTWMLEQQ